MLFIFTLGRHGLPVFPVLEGGRGGGRGSHETQEGDSHADGPGCRQEVLQVSDMFGLFAVLSSLIRHLKLLRNPLPWAKKMFHWEITFCVFKSLFLCKLWWKVRRDKGGWEGLGEEIQKSNNFFTKICFGLN